MLTRSFWEFAGQTTPRLLGRFLVIGLLLPGLWSVVGCSDPAESALLSDAGEATLQDAAAALPPDQEPELDSSLLADATPEPIDAARPLDPQALVSEGEASVQQRARSSHGALLSAQDGARSYVVESRRDAEIGPFMLPWRSRFRLAAYDRDALAWSFEAEPDDQIADVVVHPSHELTIALLRHPPERLAYELIRFSAAGDLLARQTLPAPVSVPETDYGVGQPQFGFRMKSELADATTSGWLRLIADGEGLWATFLSFVEVPVDHPLRMRLVMGLASYGFEQESYQERWARVVDGPHGADPAAWAYDELRWRDQAVRPFFTREADSGDLLVARAWNTTRCRANVASFGELRAEDCVLGAVGSNENERLPLAVTRFSGAGERRGTVILAPDLDAAEQLPFALAARAGELLVVGSVVRTLPGGERRCYPDASGFVDYDGYVSIYDTRGQLLRQRDFNQGRGDVLVALRWSERGIVAVGSAGWDRWQGGMSISRGADPLFVWLSADMSQWAARVIPLSDGSRHFNLHDVLEQGDELVGYGFGDAPMTHSADGGNEAARSFGALQVRLSLH